MGWEIVDASNANPITESLFKAELARAEAECQAYEESKTQNQGIITHTTLNSGKEQVLRASCRLYWTLPVDWSYYGHCNLEAYADCDYDADINKMLVITQSLIYRGYAMNCDSWDDLGSSIYINSTRTAVYCHFYGVVYFSYTIPEVDIKVSASQVVDNYISNTPFKKIEDSPMSMLLIHSLTIFGYILTFLQNVFYILGIICMVKYLKSNEYK